MKLRRFLIFSLIVLLLLGACASRSPMNSRPEAPGSVAPDYGRGPVGASEQSIAPQAPAPAPMLGDGTVSVERMVIQNGNLKVSVADPASSMNATAALAQSLGGFVVDSNTYTSTLYDGTAYTSATITIRVPAEKLREAMDKVKAMAVDARSGVISESLSGQDVTSDYVDSESRLRNLEAAEKQLQTLLERTEVVEDTMEIFRELTRIREEIEVTKGHMQYLKESAALSALVVEFVAEASMKPIEIGGWKPEGVAKEAIQDLIYMLQDLGSFLIRFGITCLPFLIPLAIVVWLIVRAIRKKRQARKLNPPFKPVAVEAAPKPEDANHQPEQKA